MAFTIDKLKEKAREIMNEIRVQMNTAVRIGSLFLSVIEKMEEDSATLQQSLNTEVSARQQADVTLQQSLNTEASNRQQADATLQQSLNTEVSARQQTDVTLNTHTNNAKSHIINLGQNPDIDTITTPDFYCYTVSHGMTSHHFYMIVTGISQITLVQVRFGSYCEKRVWNESWGEWTRFTDDPPADGKIYGRKDGQWVELVLSPILEVSPLEVNIPTDGTPQTVNVASNTSWMLS